MVFIPAKPQRRIALFAHYDRDGLIDDYVLYYIQGLRRVADHVAFVSDSVLKPDQAARLDGLAEFVSAERHKGYDFGSWRRGLAHVRDQLPSADELIIANCSCYAPVFPFEDVFARMEHVTCDMWGPTAKRRHGRIDHLNSYFIVFRRSVIADEAFDQFWASVEPQPSVGLVVQKYEVGLSRLMRSRGFKLASLVPSDWELAPLHGFYVRKQVHEYRSAWLKTRMFSENAMSVVHLGACLPAIAALYPRSLIDNHVRRMTGTDDPPHYHFKIGGFRWPYFHSAIFSLTGKLKRSGWWKLYVRLFGLKIPLFVYRVRK